MPVLGIAGFRKPDNVKAPGPQPSEPQSPGARPRARLSLASKAALLGGIFLVVPIIMYDQFRAADQQKQILISNSLRDQGHLIGVALEPLLAAPGTPNLPAINREFARFANDSTTIKLLYRPNVPAGAGFYYIASSAPLSNDALDTERASLGRQGVLDRLEESCAGDAAVDLRYRAPDGHDEIVTSVVPVRSATGCWAVITSLSAADMPGITLGEPYYDTPEIKVAGLIYLGMAALTFTTLWSIWRGLLRFGSRAREIGARGASGPSFVALNEVPELATVAEEFDRMVETLQNSARDIRRAAEDNAHAFKTPIAVIRQSLEPVARVITVEHGRAYRALGLIEQSVDKLDGLVASARRLDEAAADMLALPRSILDLSILIERLLDAHDEIARQGQVRLTRRVTRNVLVRANGDMIETVVENILENAMSFSRAGDTVTITLEPRGDWAELLISDEGPGVNHEDLPRIFDRYFSSRPETSASGDAAVHFGVGLWIVRRNVEALGGHIVAENSPPHGLRLRMTLPLERFTAQT